MAMYIHTACFLFDFYSYAVLFFPCIAKVSLVRKATERERVCVLLLLLLLLLLPLVLRGAKKGCMCVRNCTAALCWFEITK